MGEQERMHLELIAATLTAGMLPTVPLPVDQRTSEISDEERERILRAVDHAVMLYNSVRNRLPRL
jgi:hypothetical protein